MNETEKRIKIGMLYDIYGELLTDKQKSALEMYIVDDLNLVEIAQNKSISKQSVYEHINNSISKLEKYESILHINERDELFQTKLSEVVNLLSNIDISKKDKQIFDRAISIINRLIEQG